MFTLDGIPLHPLVIHAVVVLLPLAALGAVLLAVRPVWHRTFGIPVLLIALVAVGAVPVATQTGEQLQNALPGPNPLIEAHEERGEMLLPFAAVFLVLLVLAVVAERRGAAPTEGGTGGGTAVLTRTRLATVAAVLAAVVGLVVTGLVVWIGHSGATAVWGS